MKFSAISAFALLSLAFPTAILHAQHNAQPFGAGTMKHLIDKECTAATCKVHQMAQRKTQIQNTSNYDVSYYRPEWYIDPAKSAIKGNVTIYFTPKAPMNEIYFDIASNMTVDSAKYHGQKIVGFTRPTDQVRIPLPNSLPAAAVDSITVWYKGNPGQSGFGSFITSKHGNNVPILWTLSEPYGASDWWVCKNTTDDKADSLDVYITTPKQYRAAGQGTLISETNAGQDKGYHWRHRYPITTYLVAIAVTNYAQYTDTIPLPNGVNMPMLNYVYPEDSTIFAQQTPDQIPVMQLFSNLFEIYPYHKEKYGHAQFGWGGGMEHQTMSFVGNSNFELLAHEMAHQWFGNKITCGSFQDIWLNEGFAVYLTGLCYENMFNGQYWSLWKQLQQDEVKKQPDGSVWVVDTTDNGRIFDGRLTYAKGGQLLHMLRWTVGDTAFFTGVKNYLADPKLAFGYARTIDLQQHLEATSGKSLTEFFNDWLYGEGYPIYELMWTQDNAEATIIANQNQSHGSVSFFEMPLQFRLKGTKGEDSTVVFQHTINGQNLSFSPSFAIDSVIFDPNQWITCEYSIQDLTNSLADDLQQHLRLAPNPATDMVCIISDKIIVKGVRLYDICGKCVGEYAGSTFSVVNLPHGIYTAEIATERGRVLQKLIK